MRFKKFLPFIIFAVYLLVGVVTLPQYGINWDTINHLPRGQAYLHYFLTGKKDYSDLPDWEKYYQKSDSLLVNADTDVGNTVKRSFYQLSSEDFNWFMSHDGNGHPPTSDILSSVFNRIFFGQLRLVNDIDAYRLYGVFLGASLVMLIYLWIGEIYGKVAGFFASLSLALYPLFWSEMHFNTEKDVPETVFWSFFLYSVWRGMIKKEKKWLTASGIFFGLALGTKFNALFLPFAIFPWLFFYIFIEKGKLKPVKKELKIYWKYLIFGIIAFLLGTVLFIASWPYLWPDIIGRTLGVFKFYKTIGTTTNIDPRFTGPFGINLYPFIWIVYTTPLWILILSAIGMAASLKNVFREKHYTTLLFFLWLLLPIIRVSAPHANIYGGVRQIMEYVPPLAVFSGLGAVVLYSRIKKMFAAKAAFIVILLPFILIVFELASIHPNENVFFNVLAGGLSGAKENNIPSWGNSFGAAYRQGFDWINDNAEEGSRVVFAYELAPNFPNVLIRSDLEFSNGLRSGYLQEGEYAITLTYQGTQDRSYYDTYLERFLDPVYEASVDGVSILKVWKNDRAHLKANFDEVKVNAKYQKVNNGVFFDLGSNKKLSRLELSYIESESCRPLRSANVAISMDNENWQVLYGNLPRDWLVSVNGPQPKDGKFIEPFVGQNTRYIKINMDPPDSCFGNIRDVKLFVFK